MRIKTKAKFSHHLSTPVNSKGRKGVRLTVSVLLQNKGLITGVRQTDWFSIYFCQLELYTVVAVIYIFPNMAVCPCSCGGD